MAVLVDPAIWRWRSSSPNPRPGQRWAHLVSDRSHAELHAFAVERLGLRPQWFQGDHYDVSAEIRQRAIDLGAEAVTSRELLTRMRAAGLRRRRRRDPH